jgi:hypothetical protein
VFCGNSAQIQRQRAKRRELKANSDQTEMFITHFAGNDCVDLFFEKCVTRAVGTPDRSNRARVRSYLSMCIPATDIREHFEIGMSRSKGLSLPERRGMVLALLRRQ